MAAAHQPLGAQAAAVGRGGEGASACPSVLAAPVLAAPPRLRWLAAAPPLTLAVFLLPVVAGLAGTVAPAFGWLPALGQRDIGLEAFAWVAHQPGIVRSLWLTLGTGWAATLLSLFIAFGWAAFSHGRPAGRWVAKALAPVLATPHSALAIGLVFLIAPSGWLVRWVSPELTGWTLPPDVSTVGHPSGWPLVLGLLLKEVPYLLLMTLGALHQVQATAQLAAARALGYGPVDAWVRVVLPQVWPQLRLPVAAVLAFSLSVVDVALVLGPGHPPTLSALAVRWFSDPDLGRALPAAAAALGVLGLVVASLAAGRGLEAALGWVGRRWVESGRRGRVVASAVGAAGLAAPLLAAVSVAALGVLALWSFARQWRFPDVWPSRWTGEHWQRQAEALAGPFLSTLGIGLAATLASAVLVVACLEHEARSRRQAGRALPDRQRALAALYLPLLVPQVAFLFGLQVLLVRARLDGSVLAVVWAHAVFVLPYLHLSLADPWRAFDTRYTRSAASLGASPARVFWTIKLPLLLPPLAIACAVGFAVSVGLYLPTLFAGAGRVATLTTEAVTLSAGADRRVIGSWALVQAALPLIAFGLALAVPAAMRLGRRR